MGDLKCVKCGHSNINSKGECRQCIDWQKHVCDFPAPTSAPTSAPTEQDIQRATAIASRYESDIHEFLIRDIAAALQAERERTKEAAAKEGERFLESLKDRGDERRDGAFVAITRLVRNIRALETAQLPQGKDK